MKKPEDYTGPEYFAVPTGYIDVTSLESKGRVGIPGPDHPYYVWKDKIIQVLKEQEGESRERIAQAIMDAL